jgi:tetratricopeptide (TPR) repeat protein
VKTVGKFGRKGGLLTWYNAVRNPPGRVPAPEKISMTANELFEKGREFMDEGNTLAALACFEKAGGGAKVRGMQSYLGLCLAMERAQIREGIRLCREAIEEEPDVPVHYLHLGKVYIKAGRKDEAVVTLRRGLSQGDSEGIKKMLEDLGIRRRPFFPFLSRNHFLNKYTGLLLRRVRVR